MPRKNRSQQTKHHPSTKKVTVLKKWLPPNTYYAQTMPGLEKLAWREIEQDRPQVRLLGFETLEKKTVFSSFKLRKPMRLYLTSELLKISFSSSPPMKNFPAVETA